MQRGAVLRTCYCMRELRVADLVSGAVYIIAVRCHIPSFVRGIGRLAAACLVDDVYHTGQPKTVMYSAQPDELTQLARSCRFHVCQAEAIPVLSKADAQHRVKGVHRVQAGRPQAASSVAGRPLWPWEHPPRLSHL